MGERKNYQKTEEEFKVVEEPILEEDCDETDDEFFEQFEDSETLESIAYAIYKVYSMFKSINKLILCICILILTIVCTLCFPNAFFKMLLIIEAIGICFFALYHSRTPTTAEVNQLTFNKLTDGFTVIKPSEDGKSLSELVIQAPVEELKDTLAYAKNPNEFEDEGYTPERRVLLIGEPGLGKDALIKAFAHDANLPIVRVDASRFLENKNIFESLFSVAEYYEKFILQIDSFESLNSNSPSSAMSENPAIIMDNLNTYLATCNNVILFATCEDATTFVTDQTLQKFFKKTIVLEAPDPAERIALLKEFTSKLTLDENVNFNTISKSCMGFSVGDIKYLVSIAISIAHKKARKVIYQSDFFDALDELEYGISNKQHSEESQKIVAYHEAGHALVRYLLSGKKSVLRVVSTSRGGAGGLTFGSFDETKVVSTREELLEQVCFSYGGRCAEKLVFGHISTGAVADISSATTIIDSMVRRYGMSDEIGPINVASKLTFAGVLNESSDTLNVVASEVKRIAIECENRTMDLLSANRDKLDMLAKYLIEHETITGDEIEDLLKDANND